MSFEDAAFPTHYKQSVMTPLLKKQELDKDDVTNYRPISNLNTISKVIERLFLARISSHAERSPCFNQFQSTYRRNYSTETALLRLANDIHCNADDGSRTLLVQLDLSAAFNMFDSSILLQRLEKSFGLTGKVLQWIRSFTTGRSQSVQIAHRHAEKAALKFGVPQGSVLGPMLFSLYTHVAPISDVIKSFGIRRIQYADDTQLTNCIFHLTRPVRYQR